MGTSCRESDPEMCHVTHSRARIFGSAWVSVYGLSTLEVGEMMSLECEMKGLNLTKGRGLHRADVPGSRAVTGHLQSSLLEHSSCSDSHASSGLTLLACAL